MTKGASESPDIHIKTAEQAFDEILDISNYDEVEEVVGALLRQYQELEGEDKMPSSEFLQREIETIEEFTIQVRRRDDQDRYEVVLRMLLQTTALLEENILRRKSVRERVSETLDVPDNMDGGHGLDPDELFKGLEDETENPDDISFTNSVKANAAGEEDKSPTTGEIEQLVEEMDELAKEATEPEVPEKRKISPKEKGRRKLLQRFSVYLHEPLKGLFEISDFNPERIKDNENNEYLKLLLESIQGEMYDVLMATPKKELEELRKLQPSEKKAKLEKIRDDLQEYLEDIYKTLEDTGLGKAMGLELEPAEIVEEVTELGDEDLEEVQPEPETSEPDTPGAFSVPPPETPMADILPPIEPEPVPEIFPENEPIPTWLSGKNLEWREIYTKMAKQLQDDLTKGYSQEPTEDRGKLNDLREFIKNLDQGEPLPEDVPNSPEGDEHNKPRKAPLGISPEDKKERESAIEMAQWRKRTIAKHITTSGKIAERKNVIKYRQKIEEIDRKYEPVPSTPHPPRPAPSRPSEPSATENMDEAYADIFGPNDSTTPPPAPADTAPAALTMPEVPSYNEMIQLMENDESIREILKKLDIIRLAFGQEAVRKYHEEKIVPEGIKDEPETFFKILDKRAKKNDPLYYYSPSDSNNPTEKGLAKGYIDLLNERRPDIFQKWDADVFLAEMRKQLKIAYTNNKKLLKSE